MSKTPSLTLPASDTPAPLHQLTDQATRYLRQAKAEPLPDVHPLFQLMAWGLDQGLQLEDPQYHSDLRESVDYLTTQLEDPHPALQYLLVIPDSQPAELRLTPQQFQSAHNPKQASQLLLTALDSAMSADPNLPGYPPVSQKVAGLEA